MYFAGWRNVILGSVARIRAGDAAPQGDDYFRDGRHPFVRMQDVGRCEDMYLSTTVNKVNDLAVKDYRLQLYPKNSLLVPKSGASIALNHRALLAQDSYVVTHLAVVVPGELLLPEFLYFWSRLFDFARLAQDEGYPSLRASDIQRVEIPLPPLSEQRRVVEILREAEAVRRLRADADRKTTELIPALFLEMFGDPEANPKGWPIKSLGKLLAEEPQNGLYKPSTEYGSGTPIIRITDFYEGRLTTKEIQRVCVSEAEAASYQLNDGNILVNRVNSMEYLGKSAVVEHLTEPTIFESNMMRLSLKRDEVEPQFLIEFLQTPAALGRLRRRAKHAVNQASVNQGDVMSLTVIVPPLSVQQRFSRMVSACRSVATTGKPEGEGQLALEQELLASLLSNAFTGDLTAVWRQRHARRLVQEGRQRDEALKQAGASIKSPEGSQQIEEIFTTPTDGQWSELSSEQRELWQFIPPQPFTAASLAGNLRGPLHNRPDAVRRHLEVFCARGLLLSVKRKRQDSTERVELAQLYRKPTDGEQGWLEDEVALLARTLGGNTS